MFTDNLDPCVEINKLKRGAKKAARKQATKTSRNVSSLSKLESDQINVFLKFG